MTVTLLSKFRDKSLPMTSRDSDARWVAGDLNPMLDRVRLTKDRLLPRYELAAGLDSLMIIAHDRDVATIGRDQPGCVDPLYRTPGQSWHRTF
jgi:hypothetical protein